MRTMHLFAGHGGGLLADLILGHKPIIAVEWDEYACAVLRQRAADGWFPDLRVWEGDIQLFDPSEYAGNIHCIHAGFPCQDISVAGKQAGVGEGTRSGLYREVLRIAGIVRPRHLFLENVAAITSKGLDQVLKDISALGYDARWLCIRASDVGASHHRDRWFCLATSRVGNAKHTGWDAAEVARSIASRNDGQQEGTQQTCEFTRSGHVSDTNSEHGERRWKSQQSDSKNRKARIESEGICTNVSDISRERLEGQREITSRIEQEQHDVSDSCWWSVESNVGRVANGISNRVHRLKGLGNAQVPLQAATAYRLLGG